MKSVNTKLANKLVQTLGLKDIYDSQTIIGKEDLNNALQKLDANLLKDVAELYKNRVGERVNAGVRTPKHLMCLLRRVLRRHNILVRYKKRFKKRKAIFTYNLVC